MPEANRPEQDSWRAFEPESGNPRLDEHPELKAAVARAESVVEQASLNEAIKRIDDLLQEVDEMPVAERFSRTRKMEENKNRGVKLLPQYENMTEEQLKRQQLRIALISVRSGILTQVQKLKDVVLDIEATKKDF
jgi:hypothetical protein